RGESHPSAPAPCLPRLRPRAWVSLPRQPWDSSLEAFFVSVQIVGVLLDVLGQPERVVAHQVLGALGVARLERLDDGQMVADRTIGAVLLADGLAPDHPHVGEQVLRERDEDAVAAHADDGLVELDVHLGIFVEPGVQLAVLELREHDAQRSDLVGARVLGDEPRRHAFERGPGGDHLDHLALGFADDVNPAPRNRAHETFALELGHGFAHRRTADAELRSEPPLVEPDVGAAAVDVHGHDRVFERGVGAGLEAVRAGDRLDARRYRGTRGVGRRWARDADGTGVTSTLTHGWYTIFHGLDQCNRRVFPPPIQHSRKVGPPAAIPLPAPLTPGERTPTCDQWPS